MNSKPWSNLAKIVYRRTYARKDTGLIENWSDTVERALTGNFRKVLERPELRKEALEEMDVMRQLMLKRKSGPAGRGYWFSGAPAHQKIGGVALNNCWFLTSDFWENFVIAMDLLMLGGGVGLSVEHQFTSKLPRIKKGVTIVHKPTKDADFIVPDSREGWCELLRRALEAFFVTGKSFSYSTVCVRGYGEFIAGFGGTASGPLPLIAFMNNINKILGDRAGKSVRPIDAADLLCATGEMVVAGNVRRSAIIIIGDAFDKEYLKAKRWDLGPVPTYRSTANFSVICEEVENDLPPLFWKTYEHGEPFGLINRKNIQTYGRMGEFREDSAVGVNPCVTGETKILTDNGYFPIEELVGQKVNIWNGYEWSEVFPKVTGVNQEIVTVNFSDGRTLNCTPYHKFHIAIDYKGNSEVVEAKHLQPGMKLIKHNFPVIEHGEEYSLAYQQGFCSAEGMDGYKFIYVYEPKYMCLPRLKGRESKEYCGRKAIKFEHEFLPKSFVPFSWNLKSKLDWLSGLLDGDGTELKEGGSQLASIDRTFLFQLQELLTTLGVQSKISLLRVSGIRSMPDGHGGKKDFLCQDLWRICIGAVQIQNLKTLGLSCERLKFDKTPQRDASQFVSVVDVTENGIADKVYCFNEPKKHLGIFNGVLTGQCAEATLCPYEPCNLTEQALANIDDPNEFILSSRMCFRYAKRVTMEHYHHDQVQKIIEKNRRVGVGITGCLESPLFNPETLNDAYQAIQAEDEKYSSELGINRSIRTTVIKPSGTMSKVLDQRGEGVHSAFSRFMIQRIRVSSNDPLIPLLREAGHYMEPVVKFDGSMDHNTLVVDFYLEAPIGMPCADEGFDTWKQLDVLLMAQKYWADQAVSVTVYYKKEELQSIKEWLTNNFKYLKTISFLCHNDHGFKQAPKEAITKEKYEELIQKVRPIDIDKIGEGNSVEGLECEGGVCPIK